MNVLLVTMEMNIGGAETHILELAKELKRRNHNVFVASAGGKLVAELEEFGVTHVEAPLKDKKPNDVLSSIKIIRNIIRTNKIDIVHAHARIPGFICGYVCKREKVHFVTTIHGIYKVNFILKLLTNWGERTLGVSEDIRQYGINEYKLNPENVKVTVNGIDLNRFCKKDVSEDLGVNLDPNKKTIIHISRIDKESSKVAETLIEIADELDKRLNGVQILIVGAGNYLEELKKKSEGKSNVILVGQRTDVDKVLNKANLFVGVSRAALEAMATELPVILVGNPDYGQGYFGEFTADKLESAVENNFTCRGLDVLDKNVLLEDIVKVLNSDNLEKGKFNRKVVQDNYSVGKMTDDALELYKF